MSTRARSSECLQTHASEVERIRAAQADASEERVAAATAEAAAALEARQAELDRASVEVDGVKAELAGIESGDGRDASNRSMPERLRDTEAEIVRLAQHRCLLACMFRLLASPNLARFIEHLLPLLCRVWPASLSNCHKHACFACCIAKVSRQCTTCAVQKQQDAVAKKMKVAVTHLETEVAKAERDANSKAAADAQLQDELTAKRRAAEAAQDAFDAVPLNEQLLQELEVTVAKERQAVQQLSARRREVGGNINDILDFDFKSPRPNFDRSAVKGVLARLVRVKERQHAYALEIAAGPKLRNIIVTTNIVGALMSALSLCYKEQREQMQT